MLYIKSENDFYTSVEEALSGIDPYWMDYNGVLVLGSHAPGEIESKLKIIQEAREKKMPFLGICLGLQLAIIEFARNVLEMSLANSSEIQEKGIIPVVNKLSKLRVGIFPVEWKGGETTLESHWHNYSFNRNFDDLYKKNFYISYTGEVAEIMELKDHPFFVGGYFYILGTGFNKRCLQFPKLIYVYRVSMERYF